jgi:Holliday junction DNA helicase RuvA
MAIAAQDVAVLRQADGVGPKLAARIATELKDKVQSMSQPLAAPVKAKAGKAAGQEEPVQGTSIDSDAVSVLVNLGYGRTEAFSAVMQVRQKSNDNPAPKLDELIKLALKELAS